MMLTFITVNYRNARATIRLLDSFAAQTDRSFDIIVVDNDSSDDDRAMLGSYAASAPMPLDIIHAPTNLGFSGGNNLGIRKALSQGAIWIVLINNDTVVDADFVRQLKAALPSEPSLVGIPLNEGSRVAYGGVITWLTPTLTHAYAPGRTGYVVGAGLAVHSSVFHRIGLLDERYFLYFEDAEYSLRARRQRIPIIQLTEPAIRHEVAGTTRSLGSPLLLHYHYRNMVRLHRQYAPLWARLMLPLWMLWTALKQVGKISVGHSRGVSLAILRGLRDGLLDRSGNLLRRPVIAVEGESLEDTSWGVARQVRGLLQSFATMDEVRSRYDIVVYFKSRIPDEPWLHAPHMRAVLVRPFRWIPPSFSLYFYVFLPIRIWFDRPSVTFISNYMLPLLFRGKSIVMLTEDVWHEMYGGSLPFKYRAAYRIFATWAARRATRIMAISNASARRVAELFGIDPARIVVNELAVPHAQPVSPRTGEYLLYVAQGLPRRHLRETIQAFARIAVEYPHMTLLAIGPDKYHPPVIAELVERTNRELARSAVTWHERVNDTELASAYAGAKACIYVSDMEAFGLPPLEALAYRVPSVLMDAPVHRELFGEHAFYVTEASVPALERAFRDAITDTTRRESIARAAQTIVSRYTWDAHARRMVAIINDIL